jgi:hypothetical protein
MIEVIKIVKIYDIKDLKSLSLVNKEWYNITKIILNDFYALQFNFNKFNEYEKNLLTRNYKYLAGHFNYINKSLFLNSKELGIVFNAKKTVSCETLNCRNCSVININNYLCLLNSNNYFYEYYSSKILEETDNRFELIFYICNQMYKHIHTVEDKLFSVIKTACLKDNEFFFYFFWSLEQLSFLNSEYYEFYQTIRNSIFMEYGVEKRSIIKEIYNFIDLMKSVDITNSIEINYNLINSYLHTKKTAHMFDFSQSLVKLIKIIKQI